MAASWSSILKGIKMDTNDKDFEKMLIELKAYVDQLKLSLQLSLPETIKKTKEQYKEIADLAGELDDYFR